MSFQLVPCCSQCFAITRQEPLFDKDGVRAKTTEKLSACAKCYLARYCDTTCQKKDWSSHKEKCQKKDYFYPPVQVDELVEKVCSARSCGTLSIHLEKRTNDS